MKGAGEFADTLVVFRGSKQNAPAEIRRRVERLKLRRVQLSNTRNRLPGRNGATSPPLKPM
jgi:hypothetical protein